MADRQTDRHNAERQRGKQAAGQTGRQARRAGKQDRQNNMHTDKQTGKQAGNSGKQAHRKTCLAILLEVVGRRAGHKAVECSAARP